VRPDLPAQLPIICPACRKVTERGREMFTLALERSHREAAGEIEEGTLRCENASCGRRYPIIDGIPIVLPDLGAWLATEITSVVEDLELHVETSALLAETASSDGDTYPFMMEHISVYADAHWGDRAVPPERLAFAPFARKLAERAAFPVERAVELGASMGRGVAELARGARISVGIDRNFATLRRARRLLLGRPLPFARRAIGRHYTRAVIEPGDAASTAGFVCADALDPPLAPGFFNRVVALNLLDAVRAPARLLGVLDGLTAPAGELIVASPYSWQSAFVEEDQRIGGADPAGAVRTALKSYAIEDDADLDWSLRRDARSSTTYKVHYLRARRP
jgi:uncharacterized protein YbaR (Trm112 family)/SAM-dependent methyltransferase